MKTFTDLKREIKVGDILLTEVNNFRPSDKNIGVKRYIVKKQTNGVFLNVDKNAETGSFLEFPNAKLTEYDGERIKVYKKGSREMTEEEKKVLKNRPSRKPENKERIELEMMTDTNGSYFLDKSYFREKGMEYLMGEAKGKRYEYKTGRITDPQIRGELELQYKIIREWGEKNDKTVPKL